MRDATSAGPRGPSWAVLFLCWLVPLAASASPRQVERALELYRDGDLTRALSAFERALAAGDNAAADMPVIYRHLGELRAGSGDASGAETAFRELLRLDPQAVAAPEWSPVVVEPFERARAAVGPSTPPPGPGPAPPVPATAPPPATPPQTAAPAAPHPSPDEGALGPRLDEVGWHSSIEVGADDPFRSGWFWGGVTVFLAGAVAPAIVGLSSDGSVDGSK